MNNYTAEAVIKCLEIDVDFYRDMTIFLMKKRTKILADDLQWLTDSLNDEQAFLMKSRSLEDKRIALFTGLGIADKKLSELTDAAPEEYRPKIRMLTEQLTETIERIQELNRETSEIVKRKLDNQKEFVQRAGLIDKPEVYNNNGSKVAGGLSAAQGFRHI